jgi:hypothetical protein
VSTCKYGTKLPGSIKGVVGRLSDQQVLKSMELLIFNYEARNVFD